MSMDNEEENRVDINSASVEDFVSRLKGVGQSKAKAIVRFRTVSGYSCVTFNVLHTILMLVKAGESFRY